MNEKLRLRITVGAGTPSLFRDLKSLHEIDRAERLKYLAEIGLNSIRAGQTMAPLSPVSPATDVHPIPAPPAANPNLARVFQNLKTSLDS